MCLTIAQDHDFQAERANAFAGRMLEVLNNAGTALMTSIGHRCGLFDSLAAVGPATSAALATRADCNERYVREWLASMTVSGIVLYDPVQETYHLPAEHAALLTRAATPDNLAVLAQYIALLGGVEDDVVECFRTGGGVPYSRFQRFHEVMAEDSGQTVETALLERVLPLVSGLPERLSSGIDVLDLGCGSGRALIRLAQAFPHSRFVGYDISEEAIERARSGAERRGLGNLRFEVRDATEFDEPGAFDLVTTFDAIHDQAHPARVLASICTALKSEGVYLMQDIAGSSHLERNLDHPLAPIFYAVSCMHCMTVSLAAGGEGLGTMWGEEKALAMLSAAGFDSITVHRIEGDIQNNYYVAHPTV